MDEKQWAEKLVQVQSGLLTATEAARQLGVSRKTYYKRENRALSGLMDGLKDRESGRPGMVIDPEKERLLETVETLENELERLRQTLRIREVIAECAGGGKKGTGNGGDH
jgi:transposase